jgi:hypothetical protein
MQTEQLIYDTRRVPACLSVPIFVAGVGVVWLAAHIASSHLLGHRLLPLSGEESGSPTLGFLCSLGLGLFFLSVPFLRNRILYDSAHHQIVVRHSGLFGRSKRQLAVGAATAVEIQIGHGAHGGTHWNIWIQFSGGKREWLTQLGSVDESDNVGRSLSEAARIPLLKT